MANRNVYFDGQLDLPVTLEESRDLFVVRMQRGIHPKNLLERSLDKGIFEQTIKQVASFRDSDVYVFKLLDNADRNVNDLKEGVRKIKDSNLRFIGSVFSFSNTDFYQLYTENIFIQLGKDVEKNWISHFLEKEQLISKLPIHFGDNILFIEPRDPQKKGRDIFQYCEELLQKDEVRLCHPELVTKLRSEERERSFQSVTGQWDTLASDWWLQRIGAYRAWNKTIGEGTVVAVIDDGIDSFHPAFNYKIEHPRDMMSNDEKAFPFHRFSDKHGTACASIAASVDPEAFGVAPGAKILPVRITGLGSVLQSEAIYWAVKHGADVISCSWGPPDGMHQKGKEDNFVFPLPDHTRLAFEFAHTNGRNGLGTPILFAAGNGNEPVKYDGYASSEYVFAVSSLNVEEKKAHYADFGQPVLCSFPSGDFELDPDENPVNISGIRVADRLGDPGYDVKNYYAYFSGTSASCPGAAGVLALIYATAPDLTLPEIKQILMQSCEPYKKHDNSKQWLGYGLLRADLAVENAYSFSSKIQKTMKHTSKQAISLHIGINSVDPDYYSVYVPKLYGCINDMRAMGELSKKLGYETNFLSNEEATKDRIKKRIIGLGNEVDEGGIFMITYAGHGAPIPDKGDDEQDVADQKEGYDQSWVTYDGFLLDDELFDTLAQIKRSIRVVLVSDSCHSQSMTRLVAMDFQKDKLINRALSPDMVRAILAYNNTTAAELRKNIPARNTQDIHVYVKALSACTREQTAKEMNMRGLYTTSLIEQFDIIQGNTDINYADFVDILLDKLKKYQQPTVENSHRTSEAFDEQFPFAIEPVGSVVSPPTPLVPEVNENKNKDLSDQATLFVETNELIVAEKGNRKGQTRSVPDKTISRSILGNEKAWDRAYNYLLENYDKIDFVEPETLSRLYYTKEKSQDNRSTGSYLPTYPNPEDYPNQNPVPFIWHLNEEHSQLRKANEKVFPEILNNAEKPVNTDIVKIGHIDTGIIPDHPALPEDLNNPLNINLDPVDEDAAIALAEQQGHGNATAAILAGKWVDLDVTDNQYQGYFGAIPYARVLPIKISETVVLLSGKHFARAVDYAIEQDCDVITMSMAGLPSKVMARAVNRAYEAGVVIVSAASNCFAKGFGKVLPKRTLYPARYDRVIAAVGATVNHKPYLIEYHQGIQRAAGGEYMQTCYGPSSVLPTSIAAYTPNISWFNKKEEIGNGRFDYYVKSGGGTSSATPQVAAAAALYIQHYRTELAKYKGKDAWKKAEIVRQALFQSADNSTAYNHIYGNGLLKAYNALNPEYSPTNLAKTIRKAKAAPEKKKFLKGVWDVLIGRSVMPADEELREKLHDMLVMEINQLIYKDPDLFDYADNDKLDDETFDLSDPEFVKALMKSEFASDFLKSHLAGNSHNMQNEEFNNRMIRGRYGDLVLRSRGLQFDIASSQSYRETHNYQPYYIDEMEIEVSQSRTLRSGAKRSFDIEISEDKFESVILVERRYEDQILYEWKLDEELLDPARFENKHTRPVNRFSLNERDLGLHDRGLGEKLKKLVIKVIKWVKNEKLSSQTKINELLEPLGDSKYRIMVYDLKAPNAGGQEGWRHIQAYDKEVFEAIEEDKKDCLIMMPGLFSKVESGFDEFLELEENRTKLSRKFCRYVLGINMPTVVHGIEENARQIHNLFKKVFKSPKNCTVLARSRGGVVGRYLFEETWINNNTFKPVKDAPFVLNKLVMFGTPNQGTKIASSNQWKSLLNLATNVAKLTLGTTAPVVPKILSIVKAISLGFIDLPGINDLEVSSEVLKKLNAIKMDRTNYFVFSSHYEPDQNVLKRLFDEFLVDRMIFQQEHNDSITPVPGAVFMDPDQETEIILPSKQYHISGPDQGVSHFAYLRPEHPEILEKLFEVI